MLFQAITGKTLRLQARESVSTTRETRGFYCLTAFHDLP
jgi:hypothetical protein